MLYQKLALAVSVFAVAATVFGSGDWKQDWKEESREKLQHTFSGDSVLDVDDVNGSVHVVGDNGTTIRMEGERVTRGATRDSLNRAKREVTLDINEKNGVAQLYVNGPFRGHGRDSGSHDSDNHGFHERGFHEHNDRRDYEVTYNFTIHVPRTTELKLKSVNGSSSTEGTRGKFDMQSVNGAVTMADAGGSGTARTVNGSLTVKFKESPTNPSEFRTVNGRVEATFPPGLSADMKFKTLNGAAYSDFEVTGLPTSGEPGTRNNGKFVYRANRASSVRVGAGGPLLSFETVNGSITIRKGAN